MHRDYLGSILAVSDNNANIVEQRRFDAWGKLSDYQSFVEGLSRSRPLLDRGYTGHEHLWEVGLVHMNARMYSPLLRRFLSPDNFVADPYHTQQYNRYGYVLNNPLIYTDPSGDLPFLAVLGTALLFKSIMNVASGVPFWYGWGKTAVQAAASYAIGGVVSKGRALYDAPNTVKNLFQMGAHGLSGGVFNVLEGESFTAGFNAASLASAIGSGVGGLEIGNPALGLVAQAVAGGLSGGLGSVIAGGDFWRGAQQGAIVTVYNHAVHSIFSSEEGLGDGKKKTKTKNQSTSKTTEGGPDPGDGINAKLLLWKLYWHYQFGFGRDFNIDASTLDFSGTSQRELGLSGMKKGQSKGVNLFKSGINSNSLAFGRVLMTYQGNNRFSIASEPFDFNYQSTASFTRNAGTFVGGLVFGQFYTMPIHRFVIIRNVFFGGSFKVNFNGHVTIPK